jgi:hypothetical protein
MAMVLVPFSAYWLPRAEGYLFPAAERMVLIEARPSWEAGWTEFDGRSARLRPGCSFKRLEWFRGVRDGQHVPATVRHGKPMNRPNGVFTFKAWAVDVAPPFNFQTDTYADVLHQCRIFYSLNEKGQAVGGVELPWLTRTQFYTPE